MAKKPFGVLNKLVKVFFLLYLAKMLDLLVVHILPGRRVMNSTNGNQDERTSPSKSLEVEAHDLLWGSIEMDLKSLEASQKRSSKKTCPPGRAYEQFWEMEDGGP